MIDVILTILAFNVLIVIFKFFDRLNIDNLQALIVNYFVAGICSIYFSEQPFSITYIADAPWLIHAAVIGFLFVVVFNTYAKGTQKMGIAITTIANKLSLFIPVGVALMFYPDETITGVKASGFLLAALGIYLSAINGKKRLFKQTFWVLILVVFVGQGVADTIFNYAQRSLVEEAEKSLFFTVLFMMAGISGLFLLLIKSIQKKQTIQLKNIIGGVVLGLPNFASLLFFFNALESSNLPAAQVFPLVSMGVVVVAALIGLIFFKEKLSTLNWVGVAVSVLSIYLIAFL